MVEDKQFSALGLYNSFYIAFRLFRSVSQDISTKKEEPHGE